MGRRGLGVGFMVLASSMLLTAGSASAHRTARPQAEEPPTSECVVKSLPSFTAQGEFDTNSSIADVIEVECNPVLSEAEVEISATELYDRCDGNL